MKNINLELGETPTYRTLQDLYLIISDVLSTAPNTDDENLTNIKYDLLIDMLNLKYDIDDFLTVNYVYKNSTESIWEYKKEKR